MKNIIFIALVLLILISSLAQDAKPKNTLLMETTVAWNMNNPTFKLYKKIGAQIRLNKNDTRSKLIFLGGLQLSYFDATTGNYKPDNDNEFTLNRNVPTWNVNINGGFVTTRRLLGYKLKTAVGVPKLLDNGTKKFYYPDCIITHKIKGKLSYEMQHSLVFNWSKKLQQDLTYGVVIMY